MDWTLEVVVVPVTDVDRAKAFYTEKLGFNVDVDTNVGDAFRVVQLTPPGSRCSITIGPLVVDQVPESSARYQLCVLDIEQARAQLVERGVDVSEITSFSRTAGRTTGSSSSLIPTATTGRCRRFPRRAQRCRDVVDQCACVAVR